MRLQAQLLRLVLGREKELFITGPAGFLGHVAGKISAYTWNLIGSYPVRLVIEEIDGDRVRSVAFSGAGRMIPEPLPERAFDGTINASRGFTLHADILDHGIPVLGIALRETEHLSVNKDRLSHLGLAPGPWLADLKLNVRRCRSDEQVLEADLLDGGTREVRCGEIARDVLLRAPGQRIAYLTDIAWTPENRKRAGALAEGADLLFCETAFLDEDAELARARHHLTARQAGELAREAGAKKLAPFHISPRYSGREQELLDEAAEAFGGPVIW